MINQKHKYILYTCGLIFSIVMYPGLVNADDDSAKAGDISRGAQQWANNCSRCHNMRNPKEFRDDLWPPVVLHMRVRAGLTGQQARDIIAFLRSSNFTVEPFPVSATGAVVSTGLSGEQIFTQTCIACHGADGKGTIPGVPDLRTRLSQSDEKLLQNIESGIQTPGSPMAMPPKGGNPKLTQGDIKQDLEYLKSKFK